jgi:tetratricopeptide (TPR) repeat protein
MQRIIPSLFIGLVLVLTLGSSCRRESGGNSGNGANNTPTPEGRKDGSSPPPNITVTPPPAPASEGAMILKAVGAVSITKRGTSNPVPVLENVWFAAGDLLQVGAGAFAKIGCAEKICQLGTGQYTTCCSAECSVLVTMMRVTSANVPPVLRVQLSPQDASALNTAEMQIREMKLGEVTTQFLITNLYSGWKIQEANQELNRLSTLLAKPEAKQELKELYQPVVIKTGDLHLKQSRFQDAEKFYQIGISNLQPTDLNQRDTAIEKAAAHQGLATAYKQGGNKEEAVRNLEKARDIYIEQGDTKAVNATEKEISNTKLQRIENVTSPKTRMRAPPRNQ